MKWIQKSETTYFGIIFIMLLGKGIWTLYGLDDPLVLRFTNSWAVMAAVSTVGYLCLQISRSVAIPGLWRKDGLLLAALTGAGFAGLQILLVTLQGIQVPMVPFPLSIPVYLSVGILSELLFHYIPLVIFLFLIEKILFKGNRLKQSFWVIVLILSLWEPILQLFMMIRMDLIPHIAAGILPFLLVFTANIIPLYYIKRYGLAAAIIWRLSDYILWHIIWGGIVSY